MTARNDRLNNSGACRDEKFQSDFEPATGFFELTYQMKRRRNVGYIEGDDEPLAG